MRKPKVVNANGVTVVTFGPGHADLDSSAIADLKAVQISVEERDSPKMVIDLNSVSNIDPEFLDFLDELNQCLRFQIDGKLGICNASEHCQQILLAENRDPGHEVFETCEAAIANYSNESESR